MGSLFTNEYYIIFKDLVVPIISALGGVLSCFIAYKVYADSTKPVLNFDFQIKDDKKYDKGIIYSYLPERDNLKEGFCLKNEHYNVYLNVKNDSNKPITNLKIKYELLLYKNEITFGQDKFDIIEYQKVVYKTIEKELIIEYIPPNKQISKWIFIGDKIPACDISIIYAKSKEKDFYTNKFKLLRYDIFEISGPHDPNDLRKMLGVN